ncbi:MAG: transketolase [Candidatus Rokubacteria bacterium]|nr:transketolase [Candidatus Rokubacteria bacterium]
MRPGPQTTLAPETRTDPAPALSARAIRRIVLEQAKRANVGHIGSALCVADILAALYGSILRMAHPADPKRDCFILSKGHAALALYAALFLKGWLSREALDTYCADASLLGVHPDHALPGVDFSTGSLGHGLPMGAGVALGARLQRSSRRIFVLVSDAECNEGSLWEAVMFAAHHRLANLVAIVDLNGQQALGRTDAILALPGLEGRWQAFGWDAHVVDGHDGAAIERTIAGLDTRSGPPHVLIARTVFGKGVSFMERRLEWHYLPMSEAQYRQALAEVCGNR